MKASGLIKRASFVLFTVFLAGGLVLLATQARRNLILPTENSGKFLPQAAKMINDRLERIGHPQSDQSDPILSHAVAASLPELQRAVSIEPGFFPVKTHEQLWLYYLRPPPSSL